MEQPELLAELSANYLIKNKLLEQRKLFLWDQVAEHNSRTLVEQIIYLDSISPATPIHLYINCPGGAVTAGYAIYDMMQTVASPVYTYCIGFAASMASIILSGGEKGFRFIYPTAEVMIHQPSIGGFQGNHADIEINARQIIKTKELAAKIIAANCGQPIEKVYKDFDRDYWMNASEAIAYGIVDTIITG